MATTAASGWKRRRQDIFNSVFQTDITQPTPYLTPTPRFADQGRPFGGFAASSSASLGQAPPPQPPVFQSSSGPADDQIRFDRAWHTVTSRISLPTTASAEDSFGTLAPESQPQSQDPSREEEFNDALRLVLNPRRHLPRATHTDDVLAWHTLQVRRQFAQHVVPLLSACADVPAMMAGSEDEEMMMMMMMTDENATKHFNVHMIAVMSTVRTLEGALRMYFFGLSLIARGIRREREEERSQGSGKTLMAWSDPALLVARFKADVHALIGNAVFPARTQALRVVMTNLMGPILGIPRGMGSGRPRPPREDDVEAKAARKRLLELVGSLDDVGLAGEPFQILFAEIMDGMMTRFINVSFAGSWMGFQESSKEGSSSSSSSSRCIAELGDWVEDHFARLAIEVLSTISPSQQTKHATDPVSFADVKKWKEVAVGRLATLRISKLFDIVIHWPASRAGLDDLRASVTTPQRRRQLTDAFSAALQRRLLHPARSTLEILQVYIAMIRTFHVLDHSKVLLGRVVHHLQLYLCQRDDAVRIVVTGLLASPDEVKKAEDAVSPGQATSREIGKSGAVDGKLVELAVLLNDPAQHRRQPVDDEEPDWDDMEWVPDPADAGVNYKRPRFEDVIGTLIGVLGSPDVFIKEFQNIVAERLLSSQAAFEQEGRVLRLLQKRFGEGALQNCEVMIKDIYDSRRVDAAICRAQTLQQPGGAAGFSTPTSLQRQGGAERLQQQEEGAGKPGSVPYHARILSRLFWPSLAGERFLLPAPVAEQQKRYEEGYERLKASRRLTWLDHLGQAYVELELGDRALALDCKTHEAAVVYAFQDPDAAEGLAGAQQQPVQRSAQELEEMLQMDEELVLQALGFWVDKGVLRRVSADAYVVMETLSDEGQQQRQQQEQQQQQQHGAGVGTGAAADFEPDAAGGPARKAGAGTTAAMGAKEREQRQIYWQFINGMLTNSASSMPLGQIAMMLKMLIADGFPWNNEELQEFLGEKVTDGALEMVGGKYKLVKK